MKTAVVYSSRHHGNTRKVLDAIAARYPLTLIDAENGSQADLSGYDLIGFASGIYYSKFHTSVLEFARSRLPDGKNIFFLYTCGAGKGDYTGSIREAAESHAPKILGTFHCPGYDTFGPFKLVGGIAKGRPSQADLDNAVRFYEELLRQIS